eukprot:13228603-Ditylum_brightwellii.AAC.1
MTGMYEQAMEEWMEKPTSSKDYKEFKKLIAKKHKYLKDHLRRTAEEQGYHGVNTLATRVSTEEIAEALDNLAMATTAEKCTIEDVQATNQQLLELMQKMMEKMDRMKEGVNNIKQNVVNIRYGTAGGNNTGKGGRVGCRYYGQGGRCYGGYSGTEKRIQMVNDW